MSVVCPCCKAANEAGPACRRCKADLGLLFDLQRQRLAESRKNAVRALLDGDFQTAISCYSRSKK